MINLICSGPGPHDPADGVLGQGDVAVDGLLCPICTEKVSVQNVALAAVANATAAKVEVAQATLVTLNAGLPLWKSQLMADIAAITTGGWDGLTAQNRSDLMLRVLNGFGTAMTATVDHAFVTGALIPNA